jgi:hypothetical protein
MEFAKIISYSFGNVKRLTLKNSDEWIRLEPAFGVLKLGLQR